ncbi:MAG: hypothetical protein IKQ00_04330 [Butyrivibrio sp.]|nr:hypothetical protein [Butyrivibrio sp.]
MENKLIVRKRLLFTIIIATLVLCACSKENRTVSDDVSTEENSNLAASQEKASEACSDSKLKLIETESEIVKGRGNARICVYNDDYIDDDIITQYTFIDIIQDNEVKRTINTYCIFSEITDIDCFDYNYDEWKDIVIIGKSDSRTTVCVCRSHFESYESCLFYEDSIQESLGNDFSMNELKTILLKDGGISLAENIISDAENNTYSDYKSAYSSFLKVSDYLRFAKEDGWPGVVYSIYDINKDSTPELIVCGIDNVWVYTYSESKVHCVGEFNDNHSVLFVSPSKEGIILAGAWMGSEWYYLYSLDNNELTSKELYGGGTIYEDPETGDYDYKFTSIEDVVPDAYSLTVFSSDDVLPIENYKEE